MFEEITEVNTLEILSKKEFENNCSETEDVSLPLGMDDQQLVLDLIATMRSSRYLSISAPSCKDKEGKVINKKIIIVEFLNSAEKQDHVLPFTFINPKITYYSPETIQSEEGCGICKETFIIKRPTNIRVRFKKPNGVTDTLVLSGLLGVYFQQEYDKLHGILPYKKLSKTRKLLR